jgi:hypothetical protein
MFPATGFGLSQNENYEMSDGYKYETIFTCNDFKNMFPEILE